RTSAPPIWWATAESVFTYTRANHAAHGRLTQCVGLLAQAASQAAHATLAGCGEWITNEKTLLDRAGLRDADRIIAMAQREPGDLQHAVDQLHTLCETAVRTATDGCCHGRLVSR